MATPNRKSVFADVRYQGVRAKAYDADGNEVEVETAEDEEQAIKLEETVELLLAAGYFRARIKTLSPFDKVVGGMTWCITASNVDLEVDLLFQENSTIKQKIALTEKIVGALNRMKCPLRLEPYQIQGLDFVHMYPVVQWLVKKTIETREESTQQIRRSALLEFGRNNETPDDKAFHEVVDNAKKSLGEIRDAYKPRRLFRAPRRAAGADEETCVHSTLLEYGRRYGLSRKPKAEGSDKKAALEKSLGGASEEEDAAAAEERRIAAIMKEMAESGGDAISSSAVGSIFGKQSAAISQLSEEYAAQQAARVGAESERVGGAAAHARALTGLEKRIEQSEKRRETLAAEHAEAETAYREAQARFTQLQQERVALDKETARLDSLEGDEANKPILAQLRSLVSLIEKLKQQEQQFKATCESEAGKLQERIDRFKGLGVQVNDIDDERTKAIQKQFEEESKRLQKARMTAARRNREIAALMRKIDDVPSRAELSQYQRRFVELYEQVSAKLRETKQYFTLYNTLHDTKLYMEKEVTLLNSIHDNFTKAMATPASKEEFLKQFQNIVNGIKANKSKVDEKQTKEKAARDKLSDAYLDLVEKERQYFKSVKEYEMECAKNEVLLSKLKK